MSKTAEKLSEIKLGQNPHHSTLLKKSIFHYYNQKLAVRGGLKYKRGI
jgi:hypothetical protein